jgi:hypothetical protein
MTREASVGQPRIGRRRRIRAMALATLREGEFIDCVHVDSSFLGAPDQRSTGIG